MSCMSLAPQAKFGINTYSSSGCMQFIYDDKHLYCILYESFLKIFPSDKKI